MPTPAPFSSFGFDEEDFPPKNYADYPSGFCNLNNENLFPISKFPVLRKDSPAARSAYASIRPALVLVSRIIFERWDVYKVFIRRCREGGADELGLSKEEVVGRIRGALPDIDFDSGMRSNSNLFASALLCPEARTDQIILDYSLVRLLKSTTASHGQKLAGLLYLAILVGHEIAHILEFRNIRGGQLRLDGQESDTPSGITCGEAGIGWETRVFGGAIYPVCAPYNCLLNIRGLCIKSHSRKHDVMKLDDGFIRQLFTEEYWNCQNSQRLLRPPISKYAQYAVLQDELMDEEITTPAKSRECERL